MLLDYPVHRLTPEELAERSLRLPKRPRALFAQGDPSALRLLDRLPSRGLAVVGTRRPQSRSLDHVRATLATLAGSDLIVLSGLALGIDAAAHAAALRAGLRTIAVLAGPLDAIYPAQNAGLARDILSAGGLLITEQPPGAGLRPHQFLDRNRIVAIWAKATWIVEASHRSGALNTAKWAREHGGDCYATPCFPGDLALAGNQGLLQGGAHALWDARDLGPTWPELRELNEQGQLGLRAPRALPPGSEDAERLTKEVARHTLGRGGVRVEELLESALAWNWDPQRFFLTLQTSLNERRIQDLNGVLNAPQTHDT